MGFDVDVNMQQATREAWKTVCIWAKYLLFPWLYPVRFRGVITPLIECEVDVRIDIRTDLSSKHRPGREIEVNACIWVKAWCLFE